MDAPWIWSFWVRLPFVLGLSYKGFPWLCQLCRFAFPVSDTLQAVVVGIFAPATCLLYAILAGRVVISLWGRLQSVRALLYREFAALEMLETRLPGDDPLAWELFADHVKAIEKYAVDRGVVAPNRLNRLAALAASPGLRGDARAQALLEGLADVRAERRAAMEIGFPVVLWATLRLLALALVVSFCILAQGAPGASGAGNASGVRVLFSLLVLVLFWVNHLCRDLVDLRRGDFQLDAAELRRDTGLVGLEERAEEVARRGPGGVLRGGGGPGAAAGLDYLG